MKKMLLSQRLRRFAQLIPLSFVSAVSAGGFNIQASNEFTPAVQQLYAQAKDAQEHGDTAVAIEKYVAITRIAPDLAPVYNNLGALYLKNNELALATEALKHAVELDPGMSSASAMLGLAYFQMGNREKAEPPLRAAIKANPADDTAEITLTLILIDDKRFEEARLHLNNIVARDPKNVKALYLLRRIYLQMAEDTRIRIDEIDANSAIAHEIAGETDENALMYAGALAEYRKAIERDPNLPGLHAHIADAYWHMGEWAAAQAEYKAALQIDPNDCKARWKLADAILEARGSSEDALASLDQSIEDCPLLMQARVDRARALIRLGRPTETLSDLLMAEKDKPAEPSIHYLLASVYRAEHETAKALEEMHTFERLKQESNDAMTGPVTDVRGVADKTPR